MAFNPNIPNKSNNAHSDLDAIKENFNQLRAHEAGGTQPANPVAGMLWADNSGAEVVLKIRNKANNGYKEVGIESGTKMLFFQAAAPTGWTQVTTHNDKALRVVSGTGGGSGGSRSLSSASVGDTSITVAQMPSHSHGGNTSTDGNHSHAVTMYSSWDNNSTSPGYNAGQIPYANYATASAGNHSHSIAAQGNGDAHSHALALAYVDVIICQKD